MAAIRGKHFTSPDETRTFEKGKVEIIRVGGVTMGLGTFEPGWRWSQHVSPIAQTKSCQANHVGYLISGRMQVVMNDGTQAELGPGGAVHIPPGHDAWIVGNEPCLFLDVMGMETYATIRKPARKATKKRRPAVKTKKRTPKRKTRR